MAESIRGQGELPMADPNGRYEWSSKYGNILQTLTVVAIAIGGIYAGIIMPLHEQINEVKDNQRRGVEGDMQNITKMGDFFISQMKERITREEHEEFKLRQDKNIDAVQRDLNTLRLDFTFLRDNQVTRAEHITHWDQQKENLAEARKQIDDLRKDFGGQYTIAEKIKDLQQQLNEMRIMATPLHATVVNPGQSKAQQ